MKKYLVIISGTFQTLGEYRLDLVMDFIATGVNGLVLFLFWTSLASAGFKIGEYTPVSIGIYFILITVFSSITGYSANTIANEIKDGDIGAQLVKPINFMLAKLSASLPDKLVNTCVGSIVLFILLGLLNQRADLSSIIATTLILLVAIVGNFLIYYILGLIAFWTQQTHGISAMVSITTAVISGQLIPVELLPSVMNTVSLLLPFRYFTYFPVETFLGRLPTDQIVISFVVELLWAAALLVLAKLVWYRGIRKLEVVGI